MLCSVQTALRLNIVLLDVKHDDRQSHLHELVPLFQTFRDLSNFNAYKNIRLDDISFQRITIGNEDIELCIQRITSGSRL